MKRFLKIQIVLLLLFSGFSINAFALDENIDKYNEEFSFDEIIGGLSDEAVKILNEIGIEEISFNEIFSVSPQKVFHALFNIIENSFEKPMAFLVASFGIMVLTFLLSSFTRWKEVVDIVSGALISLCIAVPFAQVINTSFSVLESLSVFTTAFSGVFCAVVSASGQVNLGVSYTALSVFSNNLFSQILSGLSGPLINGVCAVGFLSGFDIFGFTKGLCALIKKGYVFLLSFIGTVFSGIVSLKGVLSSSSDSLTAKGIRFVIGRSLPIVGGAVSETYSSLVGSLSVLKNTIGVFGIITVAIIVLPNIISLIGWLIAFEILIAFSGVFENTGIVSMLSIFKDVLVILIATVLITATIMIVSVGVVIATKNGL